MNRIRPLSLLVLLLLVLGLAACARQEVRQPPAADRPAGEPAAPEELSEIIEPLEEPSPSDAVEEESQEPEEPEAPAAREEETTLLEEILHPDPPLSGSWQSEEEASPEAPLAVPVPDAYSEAQSEAESSVAGMPKRSVAGSGASLDDTLVAEDIELELFRLINREREEQGRTALGLEDSLHWAAKIRAPEVLGSLSHTRPDGTAYYTAFDEAGFAYAGKWHGENVTKMQFAPGVYDSFSAARAMFDRLRESPSHYQNMISDNFHQVGIGVTIQYDGSTVTIGSAQMFSSFAS